MPWMTARLCRLMNLEAKVRKVKKIFFPPPKTIFDWLCELSNIQFPPPHTPQVTRKKSFVFKSMNVARKLRDPFLLARFAFHGSQHCSLPLSISLSKLAVATFRGSIIRFTSIVVTKVREIIFLLFCISKPLISYWGQENQHFSSLL